MGLKLIFIIFFHKFWFFQSPLFCAKKLNIVRLKLIFITVFKKIEHHEIKIKLHFLIKILILSISFILFTQVDHHDIKINFH
jgi:hypothetical protein